MVPTIHVQKDSDNKVTHWGGSAPLIQYLQHVLMLPERFTKVTIKQGENAVFTVAQKFMVCLVVTILYCPRMSHINYRFKDEELLARQLGVRRIFNHSTANKFLRRSNGWTVRQLDRINADSVKQHGQFNQLERIVVDVDASTLRLSSHTKEGAKPDGKGHGKDAFQISCAFVNNQIVTPEFNPGNQHCSIGLMEILSKTRDRCGHIDLLRLDGGYLSKEHLRTIRLFKVTAENDKNIDFVAVASSTADGVKQAKEYAEKHPEQWNSCPPKHKIKRKNESVFTMNFSRIQLYSGDPESIVRLVLVKTVQKEKKVRRNRISYRRKVRVYAIVTSLGRGYSGAKVFRLYHGRQTIEQMFCELKNDYFVGKLPSNKLNANKTYFLLCCLAYNCCYYFRRDTMPKVWRTKRLMTLRHCILNIKATFKSAWVIVFDNNFGNFYIIKYIITQLERLINSQNPLTIRA